MKHHRFICRPLLSKRIPRPPSAGLSLCNRLSFNTAVTPPTAPQPPRADQTSGTVRLSAFIPLCFDFFVLHVFPRARWTAADAGLPLRTPLLAAVGSFTRSRTSVKSMRTLFCSILSFPTGLRSAASLVIEAGRIKAVRRSLWAPPGSSTEPLGWGPGLFVLFIGTKEVL